jgi:hypothetical protein
MDMSVWLVAKLQVPLRPSARLCRHTRSTPTPQSLLTCMYVQGDHMHYVMAQKRHAQERHAQTDLK